MAASRSCPSSEPPVPAASASTGPPAPPPTASPKPVIEIGAVVVEDGFVRFVDSTTRPRFVEEVSGLASTVRRLGTAPDARSPFTLSGRLSGSAPFQLEGTVGPVMGPLVLDVKGDAVRSRAHPPQPVHEPVPRVDCAAGRARPHLRLPHRGRHPRRQERGRGRAARDRPVPARRRGARAHRRAARHAGLPAQGLPRGGEDVGARHGHRSARASSTSATRCGRASGRP